MPSLRRSAATNLTALLLAQAASVGIPYGYAARTATAKLTDALPVGTRDEVTRLAQHHPRHHPLLSRRPRRSKDR